MVGKLMVACNFVIQTPSSVVVEHVCVWELKQLVVIEEYGMKILVLVIAQIIGNKLQMGLLV